MSRISRRAFMTGAAAIPFSVWFEQSGMAQTATLTRYEARSTPGQAMLKVCANAVKTMMSTGADDPRSWVFQWYTHWVRSDIGKANAINQTYPNPSPWKSLAQAMWSTCQAHGNPAKEDFFLPWHRMYVFYFESIIRNVSGNTQFTLPYWNYSVSTPAIHGVMPQPFRMQNDPVYGSLFVQKRNVADPTCNPSDPNAFCVANVNAGEPIDKYAPGALALDALQKTSYKSLGVVSGFCQELDQGLHGNVHGLIGNGQNMGAVPWAAGDPIFWMHHSNIDRLWASWNKAGRKNPTDPVKDKDFLQQTFTFANANGQQVIAMVKDFLDISKLKYTYDRFEPVSSGVGVSSAPVAETPVAPQTHAVVPTAEVALGAAPVRVNLAPPAAPAMAVSPLSSRVKALKAGKRIYLVLRGMRAVEQPGVVYTLYLDLPEGMSPRNGAAYRVGTLNFFDAVDLGDHADGTHTPMESKFRSFDVTALLQKLRRRGTLSAQPTLTIVTHGTPVTAAQPIVGEITLVEQ